MKAVKYQEQNRIIKIQLKGDYCKQHERYKTGKFAINVTKNPKKLKITKIKAHLTEDIPSQMCF